MFVRLAMMYKTDTKRTGSKNQPRRPFPGPAEWGVGVGWGEREMVSDCALGLACWEACLLDWDCYARLLSTVLSRKICRAGLFWDGRERMGGDGGGCARMDLAIAGFIQRLR